MSKQWSKVKLGEVLTPTLRAESVIPEKEYRLLGVRLEGNGPFLREVVNGTQTAATKLFRVVKDDFIYSRLFACRGAFGVIGTELDGCYVSGEFPVFEPVPGRIDVQFLRHWFRLPPIIARVDEDCSGSTPLTRNRYKEQFFLALEIPLPSFAEQQRVVARIEELTAQLNEVRNLRQQAVDEIASLLRSIIQNEPTSPTPLGELMAQRAPEVIVQRNESYQFAGVYSFGRGVFRGNRKSGADFAYPKLSRLRTGDFVYPKLMAWEGAFGVTPAECDGYVVSTEFPVFEVNEDRVFPEVLDVYFRNPAVWADVAGESIGTNARRRRLNPKDLLEYRFPLPPRNVQNQLREVSVRLLELKHLQAETNSELDALLPAILDRAFKGEL